MNKHENSNGSNRVQSSLVAPLDRVALIGATCGTGRGTNLFYDLNNHQEQKDSPDVVTCIIHVFDFINYIFLD